MVDTQKVGAFIAQCRKEHNWTQKELGEKLGVTDKAVSKWENGRSFPDITLLESLCETFDITVSELLSGKKIEPEDDHKQRGAANDFNVNQSRNVQPALLGNTHQPDEQTQPESPENSAQSQQNAHGQTAQRAVGVGAEQEISQIVVYYFPVHFYGPC